MDLLINSEGFIEEVHSSIATSYHEFPLDFLGLNLSSTVKVDNSLLELILLGMVHTQAGDHINLGWVVAE